jgi:hypothetical protein
MAPPYYDARVITISNPDMPETSETEFITVDWQRNIRFDKNNPPINLRAVAQGYAGLHMLAETVRENEIEAVRKDPHAKHTVLAYGLIYPAIIPNAFNWYALTLVNYLRALGLIEFLISEKLAFSSLLDRSIANKVRTHCGEYVIEAIPEIHAWRNKVSAHYAATDPRKDNIGTLMQSLMDPIVYKYPHFRAGGVKVAFDGGLAELPNWSLTETHERLSPRFWPEFKLPPVD